MAIDKSKSRARPSRNRARPTASSASGDSDSRLPPIASTPLQDAIETERARLMRAEAVLHCVVLAMDVTEGDNAGAPHYQAAIDLARDLIVQTIDQLDSVRLKPLLGMTGARRMYGVKESAGEYLH
jgi:hypothetical protein